MAQAIPSAPLSGVPEGFSMLNSSAPEYSVQPPYFYNHDPVVAHHMAAAYASRPPVVHAHARNNFPSFPNTRQFYDQQQMYTQMYGMRDDRASNSRPYEDSWNPEGNRGGRNQLGAGLNLRPVSWTEEQLPKLNEAAYVEHSELAQYTDKEVEELYHHLDVTVQGSTPPKPIQRFDQAPFPSWILEELRRSGYTSPYPIQCVGWPVALSNRDMIGIAQTGSGKTLAYLLPALVHIGHQPSLQAGDGPIILVLAPTRELAMQIEKEASRFTRGPKLSVTCVFGGVPRGGQATDLMNGVHVCIATPGRLLDFLASGTTNLKRVTYLVLDEADRMLDMGFEPQMRAIVSQIRPERQTLMWSATWPRAVQKLARDFCRHDPVRVTVGSHDLQANSNINQLVEVCRDEHRFLRLVHHLMSHSDAAPAPQTSHMMQTAHMQSPGQSRKKALVFCETKRGCDVLRERLRGQRMLQVAAIHGDKEQRERDRILSEFKSGRVNILIATDVASRGLDIKNIDLVVNYDVPKTIEDYIHRIGRTGRAGASGTAITLFSDSLGETEKYRMAREIALVMRDVGQTPPQELTNLACKSVPMGSPSGFGFRGGRGGFGGRGRGGRFNPHQQRNSSNFNGSVQPNHFDPRHEGNRGIEGKFEGKGFNRGPQFEQVYDSEMRGDARRPRNFNGALRRPDFENFQRNY